MVRPVWAGPGVNLLGAPSPDGRFLSCVETPGGDLAVRDLATGQMRRLTRKPADSREYAYFSVVSPDSSLVAYAWFNDEGFYDLRVVAADGKSEPRILYRNEESGFVQPSAFSPDGKQILTLFFRKDNISQIALVPATGGGVRVLKSLNWVYPKRMDFSPDGRFVVYDNFARDGAPERDIFVLAADGSRETRLIEHPADDLFPVWMPDGKRILFASTRAGTLDAWIAGVEGGTARGEPKLVRRNLERFLPLGVTRRGALYFGQRTGASVIGITPADPGGIVGEGTSPAWSPDGAMLAYLARRGTENVGQESRFIAVLQPSGPPRELLPALAFIDRIRWAPDGESLVAGGSDGKGRAGLFRVDLKSGAARPLLLDENATFRGIDGVLGGDGKTLWYGGASLRRRSLESGEETVVYAAVAQDLALSPDGGRLAFRSGAAILVMPAAGGAAEPRFTGEGIVFAWRGDSRSLIAVRAGELWDAPLDGAPKRLGSADWSSFSVNAKRNQIAYAKGQARNEVWVMERF